jgi:hypothetical protein
MKNVYIKILIFECLVILFNTGCKDCNKDGSCDEEYYRKTFGEMKSYFWAKEGSYWIYKNTQTGDLDTQTCTSFYFDSIKVRGTFNNTKYKVLEYDKLARTTYSSFNMTFISDESINVSPDSRSFNNGVNKIDRSTSSSNGYITAFMHPFIDGYGSSTGSSITRFIGLDSTLSIQGKTYYNVAKFELDEDDIWYNNANYPNTVYYWAKDVGLIKRWNKTDNYSWELMQYNIIK